MAAVLRQLAEAIQDELNAASFSQSFVAVRRYLPVYDREDFRKLRVTVCPRQQEYEPRNRSQDQRDYQIDIGVQQAYRDDPEDLDALVDLVEEIVDHFRGRTLTGTDARWIRTTNETAAAREHMETLSQFTSVITLTYRLVK